MNWILSKLRNLITRVKSDPAGLVSAGGQTFPDTEYFEPQGLHFKYPSSGAQGLTVAPSAMLSAAVAVNVQGDVPGDSIAECEGGLHYMGLYKVFLAADGSVHLGQKNPADYVALASKVDTALSAINTWANAHVHTSAAPGSPTTTTVAPLAPAAPTGSLIVKAQ